MFCRYCGNPSETPVCPTCAAAQAQDAQPVVAPEETQVVTPEVTQPVMPEPVAVAQPVDVQPVAPEYPQPMQIAQPEYAQPEPPKKKSKKGLWISLVAVVAAVGVAVFAFWPTLSHLFQSPEDYLKDVTTDSLSSYTDGIASLYGVYLKGEVPERDYNHMDTKFSLKLGDGLAGMLATALQSEGINLTAETLKSIDLTASTAIDGDPMQPNLIQYDLGVGLGGKNLLGINATLDYKNSVVYLAVPQLSEKYLKVDLKAQFGIDLSTMSPMDMLMGIYGLDSSVAADDNYVDFGTDYEDYYDDEDLYGDIDYDDLYGDDNDLYLEPPTFSTNSVLNTYMELLDSEHFATLQAALPSEDEFQAMLDGFIDVALEQITQVEKTSEDVTVDGHTQNQTALVATIDEAAACNMAKAVLQQAQNDGTLKKMLDAVDAFVQSAAGQSLDLHSQMAAGIPELIAELDELTLESNPAEALKLTTYVDGDEVMGCKISAEGMDVLSYTTVQDGDTYYFQISSPMVVLGSVSGSYTEDGDVTKGNITLAVQGVNFTLGYEYSDTGFTLSFAPPAELMNEMLSELGVPSGIVADNVALELGAWTSNTTVTLPENAVDLTDQAQLMAWVTEAVGKLPNLLKDLGLPESIINDLMGELF